MKGMIFSEEAVQKIFHTELENGFSLNSAKTDRSQIKRLVKQGMVIGNIIPLDEDLCMKLNTGYTMINCKEKRWLRRAIATCKTYGEVINFDENTGRME